MLTERDSLDERKAAVLRAIVAHYVRSGEPVGSKTIAERSRLGVSPATVRNEMAALEEAGYIYQPHTSAGRIPTDAGYRYFVDTWGRVAKLSHEDARRIERFFGEPRWELEDSLRRTAMLLSRITDHAAVVFAPALGSSNVRHVDLVGIHEGRAMLVLVADTGRVENYIIPVAEELDEIHLESCSEMVNRIVAGAPLEEAAETIEGAVERFPLEMRDLVGSMVATMKEELSGRDAERFFLEGAANIVDEQKFADLETVREVISALERRRILLEVLADGLAQQSVSVRIGSENRIEQMQSCSVITAGYGAPDAVLGSLGVVGPTRMDYRRVIPAVHEVASQLGRLLSELT